MKQTSRHGLLSLAEYQRQRAVPRKRVIAVLSEAAHQLYVQCRGFVRVPMQANEDPTHRRLRTA